MEKNSFLESLYKNAGYYCVGLISLIYIAGSLILISKTGKSIYEIIGTGFISMVVGSLINGSLRSVGVRRGEENEKMIEAQKNHAEVLCQVSPHLDKLEEFCDSENKAAVKKIRMKILAAVGLKYNDCFDENGVCKELLLTQDRKNRRKNRKIRSAYRKAVNLKIKELTVDSLTFDDGSSDNPFDFGKSKREFSKSKNATDIITRVIMAIIFGYFGVTLVSEINFATIIWNALQIVMYITSGVVGMYSTYMWIVDDYRQGILKKIEYLNRFLAQARNL